MVQTTQAAPSPLQRPKQDFVEPAIEVENPTQIIRFEGPYGFLALEHPCKVVYNDNVYGNAAVLFYALRATTERSRAKIARLSTNKARQKSSALPENLDYDENRDHYLKVALRAKFESNPGLKTMLLKTKPKELINTVSYLDDWIGIRESNGRGSNMLGKALMELRDEYEGQDLNSY